MPVEESSYMNVLGDHQTAIDSLSNRINVLKDQVTTDLDMVNLNSTFNSTLIAVAVALVACGCIICLWRMHKRIKALENCINAMGK